MLKPTSKVPAKAKAQSSAKPEITVNQDALVIGDTTYLMDDIKAVEIKHWCWQHWVACASFLLAIYLYNFYPDMLVVAGWSKKADGFFVLAGILFIMWGNSMPAQMVIGLPGKRLQVLEHPEKELKEIRKKVLAFKKAKKAAAVPQR